MTDTSSAALRGQVEFSEAGDSVYLQLRGTDLLSLQQWWEKRGGGKDGGRDWWPKTCVGLDTYDLELISTLVNYAAKKNGRKLVVNLGEVDISVHELMIRCRDCLFYGMYGKSFAAYSDEINQKVAAEGEPDEDPQNTPAESSAG